MSMQRALQLCFSVVHLKPVWWNRNIHISISAQPTFHFHNPFLCLKSSVFHFTHVTTAIRCWTQQCCQHTADLRSVRGCLELSGLIQHPQYICDIFSITVLSFLKAYWHHWCSTVLIIVIRQFQAEWVLRHQHSSCMYIYNNDNNHVLCCLLVWVDVSFHSCITPHPVPLNHRSDSWMVKTVIKDPGKQMRLMELWQLSAISHWHWGRTHLLAIFNSVTFKGHYTQTLSRLCHTDMNTRAVAHINTPHVLTHNF